MRCPTTFVADMTIFCYHTDINNKEDEIRNIINDFRKGVKIIQADHMTHLESLYEELLETSKEFNTLVISRSYDLDKFNELYELFIDKYKLIKEFINQYY